MSDRNARALLLRQTPWLEAFDSLHTSGLMPWPTTLLRG